MSIDLAQRVHDHNYNLDPFVRSLMDTDFYKLLMAQYILKWNPSVHVAFDVKNRSSAKIKLLDVISEDALRAQLDHVKGLRFTPSELIWLQGNTFYGQTGIFTPEFISALRDLRLPDYHLARNAEGEYKLTFTGTWFEVTLWEIYALSILNEAKSRAAMRGMSKYELRVLYANATTKIVGKLKSLKAAGVPRISEFGTRRRHGFLWQRFVIEAMQEELGGAFLGTSNALHAMQFGVEAIGTNAHELPMVEAALACINKPGNKDALFRSQYDVLEKWQKTFGGNLLVALPDTFGSTQFLKNAPEFFPDIRNWRGMRPDSKDPALAACELIAFWKNLGEDPREKLVLFSDGLDVEKMISLHAASKGEIRDGYGWGTLATNDFRGCDPRGGTTLDPISIVCKVSQVMTPEGAVSAVKLSDNYEKATGEPRAVNLYREVFGSEGMKGAPLFV